MCTTMYTYYVCVFIPHLYDTHLYSINNDITLCCALYHSDIAICNKKLECLCTVLENIRVKSSG